MRPPCSEFVFTSPTLIRPLRDLRRFEFVLEPVLEPVFELVLEPVLELELDDALNMKFKYSRIDYE